VGARVVAVVKLKDMWVMYTANAVWLLVNQGVKQLVEVLGGGVVYGDVVFGQVSCKVYF